VCIHSVIDFAVPDTFVGIVFAVRVAPEPLPREPSHRRRQSQPVVETVDPAQNGKRHRSQYQIPHRIVSCGHQINQKNVQYKHNTSRVHVSITVFGRRKQTHRSVAYACRR